MPPSFQKRVQQTQFPGLAHAPGGQPLAANAVHVNAGPFEHQDSKANSRQTGGQCPSGDASTNDHNVIVVADGHYGPPAD